MLCANWRKTNTPWQTLAPAWLAQCHACKFVQALTFSNAEKHMIDDTFLKFSWALQRLAAMQGTSIDVLLLQEAEQLISGAKNPLSQLKQVCKKIGLPAPTFPRQPDRVHLPMICYTEEHEWAVVVDRSPQGQWVIAKADGLHTAESNQLEGCLAAIKVISHTSLGWQIGRASCRERVSSPV